MSEGSDCSLMKSRPSLHQLTPNIVIFGLLNSTEFTSVKVEILITTKKSNHKDSGFPKYIA